jgi:hypothetical protein
LRDQSGACTDGAMRLALFLASLLTILPLRAGAAGLFELTGSWAGWYDCAQGATALELDVVVASPQKIQALFYFHTLPSARPVPDGCFLMQGTADGQSGTLQLQPGQWILWPFGFVPVGLDGRLNPDGTLTGRIFGPGCSQFSLTRQPAPQAPDRCLQPLGLGFS